LNKQHVIFVDVGELPLGMRGKTQAKTAHLLEMAQQIVLTDVFL
jgi:hypothetical protein